MIQCPECRQSLPDDSAFCDQCGKELKWCPECGRPKRGTECPVCGSDLVPGRKWLAAGSAAAPQKTATAVSADGPGALVGNGWRLTLQEGAFGRAGGIWPELGTSPYVSGSHGKIVKDTAGWKIVDNGSTNGTYVNGMRIQNAVLKKGDRIRIANLEFTVE